MGASNSTILDRGHEVTPVQTWVQSPNTRGTFDILWGCGQTVFLCAWVSICVNLPASGSKTYDLTRDKFHFTLLTLLGPELVFMLAFSQFLQARTSAQIFRAHGYTSWTIVHSFYADMGGVSVEPPQWSRFPVNSREILYLVKRGYMSYPQIELDDIRARSKSDGLARVVTVVQTLYFTVSTIARPLTGLAVTTLELTVLGFILCTLGTSIAWWHKPNDVEAGHTFALTSNLEQIITEADEDLKTWPCQHTPLDFISCSPWVSDRLWHYYVNILRQMGLFPARHTAFPVNRFSSFNWPSPVSRHATILLIGMALVYSGTFFGAWNFHFPTFVELWLWRGISIAQSAIIMLAGTFEILFLYIPNKSANASLPADSAAPATTVLATRIDTNDAVPSSKKRIKDIGSRLRRYWNRPCNNSIQQHPALDVPLRSLLITTPLCAAYCFCRWYLIVEDLIGLRSVAPSVYHTVDWTQYWPSFSNS